MMLNSKKHITILGGDTEVETRSVKLTLYNFNMSKASVSLEPVVGSRYSSTLIKLRNAVCTSYQNDGVIVVSVLDQITQQASNRMTFHLFSPIKTSGKNWKVATLLLPTVLHSVDGSKYQVQSCVMISHYLYCSVWLHETIAYIFKVDLLPLQQYNKCNSDKLLINFSVII